MPTLRSATMAPMVDLAPYGHSPTVWPLEAFVQGDFASVGECAMQLDRTNSQFGLLYVLEETEAVIAQLLDDKSVYFEATSALAVCHRYKTCKKVSILFLEHQIDMEFVSPGLAQSFVLTLKSLGTNALAVYEMPFNVAFQREDFYMLKHGYREQQHFASCIVPGTMTTRLWQTGEYSDFVVTAGDKTFNVHKWVLCLQSKFFENACKSGFEESINNAIHLAEDAATTEALLTSLYGVENPTTGSLFTTFALKTTMEKASIMHTLLRLFIAADKYRISATKSRAATAFIDRLHFTHDPLVLLGLAAAIFANCPDDDADDGNLRSAIVRYIQARLPKILCDKRATDELLQNPAVTVAVLRGFADMVTSGALTVGVKASGVLCTPPVSPAKLKKVASKGSRGGSGGK